MTRQPPTWVKRKLRREVNYGCAICGNPLLEYHHILPYSEEEHHDPEDMIALCPNHHSHAGPNAEAITPDRLREHKDNPHNDSAVDYDFHYRTSRPTIMAGHNLFQLVHRNVITILEINGRSLFELRFEGKRFHLSSWLYDENNELMAEIDNNEWVAYADNVWDLIYKPHMLKIWHELRDIGILVAYDSSKDLIQVHGRFTYDGISIRITPGKIEGVTIDVADSFFRDPSPAISVEETEDGDIRGYIG